MSESRELVLQQRPQHLPMWQLHAGSSQWLEQLASTMGWWGCEQYDVADCFFNIYREAVMNASLFVAHHRELFQEAAELFH